MQRAECRLRRVNVGAPMNALQQAHAIGQSIWLDGVDRELLDSGRLAELIGEGVRKLPMAS